MNSRNLLFLPFIYLSLPRFVICELFTSWLHKFANSRFNNQKFVILSIKYECALKNSSNHRVVIRKWSLVICKGFFRMTTLWFDKFFWFAKLFNDGGVTTIAIWEWVFFGITVYFMIQKLKSKHLVCHGFLWWEVFLREQVKIFCTYSGPNFAEIIASPEDRLRMIRFGES